MNTENEGLSWEAPGDRTAIGIRSAAYTVLWHPAFPVACVALAVVLRIAWILLVDARPTSDFSWYFEQGNRIASGKGFTVDHDGFPLWERGEMLPAPRPTAFWPVGYPAFLGGVLYLTGGFLPALLSAKLANVALYAGLLVSVTYAAKVIFRSELAGRCALLLAAFIPNHIAYVSLTSVEILFAFLSSAGVALLLRARVAGSLPLLGVSGAVFGLATLTKPQAVFVPAVLIAVLTWKHPKRALLEAAVAYSALTLVLSPWLLRNFQAFGRPIFVSSNGWINLLIGNMPGAWGNHGLMWNEELHQVVSQFRTEPEWNDGAKAVVMNYLSKHPGDVLASLPMKLFWLYAADVDGFGWNRMATPTLAGAAFWTPIRYVSQAYYLVLLSGALLSLAIFRRALSGYLLVGPALAAYFSLLYMVFFGGSRFHFPVVPWMAVYAGGVLAFAVSRRSPVPAGAGGG